MAEAPREKEQAKEPSGFEDAIRMFNEDQAEAAAKASETPSENEEAKEKKSDESQETKENKENAEETCTTCGDENKEEKEPETEEETKEDEGKPEYKIVNEKGEEVPLIVKADGKEHTIDDMEKLKQYLEYGIHASQKLEEANKLIGSNQQREQELETAIQEVQKLIDFYQEKGKPSGESDEDSFDDDDIIDPEIKALKKELNTLKKEYENKIETQNETLKKITLSILSDGLKKDMAKAIEKYPSLKIIPEKEEKIFLYMRKKDENGDFVYKGLDAAAKAVSDEWEKGFQNYTKQSKIILKKSRKKKRLQ